MDISTPFVASASDVVPDTTALQKPVVRIAVISRYPPTVTFRGYQPVIDYLTSQTPYRFELLLGADYQEALQHLRTGRAAAVFMGSYLYARERSRADIVPILKPLNANREALSRSVLFVRHGSPIQSMQDLAGRRLALPSAESYSANWADHWLPSVVKRSGTAPPEVRHFAHHHTVIAKVLNGTFDAGVTREVLVKEQIGTTFRALAFSDPIPSPPIVVRSDADTAVVQALREALLAVNRDESRRREITRGWDNEFVYGFAPATASDYDPVGRRP
jgi:phosphonate transport system substrate-binding protein